MPRQQSTAAEIRRLLGRVESVAPTMPPEDAPNPQWEDWGSLQQIQAILAGYASTLLAGGDADDLGMLADARRLLDRPGVQALIGDHLADHLTLMDLIAHAR